MSVGPTAWRGVAVWLVLTFAGGAFVGGAFVGGASAGLADDVDAVLNGHASLRRGEVSVSIRLLGPTPDADEILYRRDDRTPLIPASNLKVVTAAAALDRLGADFVFRTVLAVREESAGPSVQTGPSGLRRTLAIVGDGDPTLGDGELLRPFEWGIDTLFRRWAQTLRDRGVTSADRLWYDDSVFDDDFLHAGWPMDQTDRGYVPQIGGLNLNANLIDVYVRPREDGERVGFRTDPPTGYVDVVNTCVGGGLNAVTLTRPLGGNRVLLGGTTDARREQGPLVVTIHDPPAYAATVLIETLRDAGVEVRGEPRRDASVRRSLLSPGRGGWRVVGILETSMPTVLARLNKDSANLYAEALCKRVGFAATGEPGSWANGTAEIGRYLESLGIPSGEFRIRDGSGLTRENRLSAHAITTVLSATHHSPASEAFYTSLSTAGSDGTLRNRFADARGQALRGRVVGKSGFINHVSCLSGYLDAADGRRYAFSVLVNGLPIGGTGPARAAQEAIVRAIDRHAAATMAATP